MLFSDIPQSTPFGTEPAMPLSSPDSLPPTSPPHSSPLPPSEHLSHFNSLSSNDKVSLLSDKGHDMYALYPQFDVYNDMSLVSAKGELTDDNSDSVTMRFWTKRSG